MMKLTANNGIRCLVPGMLLALSACDGPATERVTDAPAPVITTTPRGRVVHNPGAPERFLPRLGVPSRPTFLFSGVLAVAADDAGRQAVLPPSGDRLLLFDARGRFVRSVGDGSFVRGIAVTSAANGWLVVERDGGVLFVADTGAISQSRLSFAGTAARAGPLASIGLSTLSRFGDGFVAARSSFASAGTPERVGAPLLLEIDPAGRVSAAIDTTTHLGDPTLTAIANSGHLSASDSLIFFAPLTRDEVRAYDRTGRRRWTADRALGWARPPTGGVGAGQSLSYRPVNLSIAARDSLVYVLAFADSLGDAMRVDAFDAETGVLRRSASLPTATMLISLDDDGALWHAPADTLRVIGAPPNTVFVDFDLPTPTGDTLSLRSLRGKVVLLNIWASWCGPCRDEFPLMTQLARELANEEFAVVAVSDDLDEGAARKFVAEFDPPFAIAWGRESLQRQLNYRGLPFTVLLDREGRVVQRYIGFGGARQFESLRADVLRAIRAP